MLCKEKGCSKIVYWTKFHDEGTREWLYFQKEGERKAVISKKPLAYCVKHFPKDKRYKSGT